MVSFLASISVSLLVLCILYLVNERMLSYNSISELDIKFKLKTLYDMKLFSINRNRAKRQHHYNLLERL